MMNQVLFKLTLTLAAIGIGVAAVAVTGKALTGIAVGSFLLCGALSIRGVGRRSVEVETTAWIVINALISVVLSTVGLAFYGMVGTSQSPPQQTAWFVVGWAAALYCGGLALVISAPCASLAAVPLLIARHQLCRLERRSGFKS